MIAIAIFGVCYTSSGVTVPWAAAASRTPAPHIMVIMMENKNYAEVIGSPTAPFTSHLAYSNGIATESFALQTGSLPNYLALVSGSTQGVDNVFPSQTSFPNTQTLANQLQSAGYSAKAYAEDLPANPTTNAGEYGVQHFPWPYFPNAHIPIADASQLMADLNSPKAPDFVWYTPNLIDDEHDGTIQDGDHFLHTFVPEVQATSWYAQGGKIVLEWDESDNDTSSVNGASGGGGHIPTIVISAALSEHPQQVSKPVDTLGILRSIEDQYGLAPLAYAQDPVHGDIDSLLSASVPATAPKSGAATATTAPRVGAVRVASDSSMAHVQELLLVLLAIPIALGAALALRARRNRPRRRRGLHVKR